MELLGPKEMEEKLQGITEVQQNDEGSKDLQISNVKLEITRAKRIPEQNDVGQIILTRDQKSQQEIKVRIYPQSQTRKSGGCEKSSSEYVNLKIDKEKNHERVRYIQ